MTGYENSQKFRAALIDARLLVPGAVDGLYAKSGTYEQVAGAVTRLATRSGAYLGAEQYWYPPIMPRTAYERTGYPSAFPDLAGTIGIFDGNDKAHAALVRTLDEHGDWTAHFRASEVVLCSAACHQIYDMLTGTVLDGPRHVELQAPVFRHEPSADPMRMQSFRMHEFVHLGTPESAMDYRNDWVGRGLDLLARIGLDARPEVANDPFFGRIGRILASSQLETQLKIELLVSATDENETAVMSANCHQEHFSEPFDIRTADGALAHSSCFAFGVDRLVLALFARHGLRPDEWPAEVRAELR